MIITGVIKKRLLIHGDKSDKEMKVIFDSGATDNYMLRFDAEEVCNVQPILDKKGHKTTLPVTLGDGTKRNIIGECLVSTDIDGYRISGKIRVIDSDKGNADFYIGAPILQDNYIKMGFRRKPRGNKEPQDYLDFSDYYEQFQWS